VGLQLATSTSAEPLIAMLRRLAAGEQIGALSCIAVPPPGKGEKADRLHLANFPGLEETFGISFDPDECSALSIPLSEIEHATRLQNLNEAVDKVARLYIDRVKKHLNNEERAVNVWMLVLPEIVYDRCRPGSKRSGLVLEKGDFSKKQKAKATLPLLASVVDLQGEEIFDDVPDFHRRIKAEFLKIAPTQLLRESTLAPGKFLNTAGYPVRKGRKYSHRSTALTSMAMPCGLI